MLPASISRSVHNAEVGLAVVMGIAVTVIYVSTITFVYAPLTFHEPPGFIPGCPTFFNFFSTVIVTVLLGIVSLIRHQLTGVLTILNQL